MEERTEHGPRRTPRSRVCPERRSGGLRRLWRRRGTSLPEPAGCRGPLPAQTREPGAGAWYFLAFQGVCREKPEVSARQVVVVATRAEAGQGIQEPEMPRAFDTMGPLRPGETTATAAQHKRGPLSVSPAGQRFPACYLIVGSGRSLNSARRARMPERCSPGPGESLHVQERLQRACRSSPQQAPVHAGIRLSSSGEGTSQTPASRGRSRRD